MYLMHRNTIAWILLLIASATWIYGRWEITNSYSMPTEPTATTYHAQSDSDMATRPSTDPSSDSSDHIDPGYYQADRGMQFIGYSLCMTAAVCVISGVVILRQKAPSFGPDIVSGISAVYCWVYHTYLWGQGSPQSFFMERFIQILLLWILFLCARELWGWVLSGFSFRWSLLHRLSNRFSAPQVFMILCVVWVITAIVGIALIIHGRSWLSVLLLAFFGAFGFSGLWRIGLDIKHFQTQLDHFQKGGTISAREGFLYQAEKALQGVQQQQEEAIRTAVTSERFKVDLITNVSHDLRTPLTSILGYSELLLKEPLTGQGKERLKRLYEKAGYMSDLVESLFELTKVSSGVVKSKKQPLDLIRLLEQTIGLFDDRLMSSGLVIRRSYVSESIILTTDGARLHQVFVNLLGNAIKYALPGTRIHLEVKESELGWIVRVVNTASYVMDFQEEEILQRFVRGDKARSTQGSGLGLAIAQTYTESVGGSFRIQVDGDQFNAMVELPKS